MNKTGQHGMLPKVVIIGRPNVGKSSLLNLLAGRRISIVDPTAGVTRDRVSAYVKLTPQGREIELVDTGGYGVEDVQNLTAEIEHQIEWAIGQADLILFVTDAQTGVLPLDQAVARLLRDRSGTTPVLAIANKVDGSEHESSAAEAAGLGFGFPLPISATNGYNREQLREAITDRLQKTPTAAKGSGGAGLQIAIVGKRNAGKSTLVNSLAGEERMIVSDQEGTTRDSVDVRFSAGDNTFTAIDTAGVRKTKSIKSDIDFYSHHRALRSIRRADVVFLLLDATVPISQVDTQLTQEVLEHFKPCIVVINKWDLAEEKSTQDEFAKYLDKALPGLGFAPLAFVSAQRSEGLKELLETAQQLHKQASHRVSTGQLNRVLEELIAAKPPSSKSGRRPKIYYVTQLDVHPPTIGLFVNEPERFDATYQRYLLNRLRELLPFGEVPIKLVIRGRSKAEVEAKGT